MFVCDLRGKMYGHAEAMILVIDFKIFQVTWF